MQSTHIVYGIHAVTHLLKHQPQTIQALYIDKDRRDDKIQQLKQLAQKQNIAIEIVKKQKINQLSDSDRHQGVVAISEDDKTQPTLEQIIADSDNQALLLILDGITDPHNLGACLRTADAAGVCAVIYPKDKSASITPVVRKVASGAYETMPVFPVTNLARTIDQIKAQGIWVLGAAGEAQDDLYTQKFSGKLALVMGAEGRGLRRLTREKCDYLIKLPMLGQVSSLNVSVATGICLYELRRQQGLSKDAC